MRTGNLLFLLILLSSTLTIFAQTESEKNFLSQFSGYKKTTEIQKENLDSHTVLKTEGLQQITRHRFKSKRSVAPKTHLSFSLAIFEYDTSENAAAAFMNFQEKVEEQFIKTPEIIALLKNKIYRLGGGCLHSTKEWEAIGEKFENAIFGVDKPADEKTIKILCGGEVL